MHQLLVELGIEYKQIHSCINDCILYRDKYKNMVELLVCKYKRYRTYAKGSIVPTKVLWNMLITSILQLMFCCKSLAQFQCIHAHFEEISMSSLFTYDCIRWMDKIGDVDVGSPMMLRESYPKVCICGNDE